MCMLNNFFRYEVVDEDYKHDPEATKKSFLVSPSEVIELQNPETPGYTEFPQGTQVMAMFPSTTTFYPAVVHSPPVHKVHKFIYFTLSTTEKQEQKTLALSTYVC